MLRFGLVPAFTWLLLTTLVSPVSGQTVVYSNQNDIESLGIGIEPPTVFWDDLQLTRGGTLSEISIVVWRHDPDQRSASGFIDLRLFDEANNVPQGTPIGLIPFDGTFAAFPGNSMYTLISLDGLESLNLALPATARIGAGLYLDEVGWFHPGAGTPTFGSSPGDNWLGSHPLERQDATGDFGWRVVVAETAPLVKWNTATGSWDDPNDWDTGFTPMPSQDVLVRSTGSVATVTGPASDVTVRSVQVGELAFSNTTLRLQPGTTLTATDSFLLSFNGFLDVNGGRLVTGDFRGQPNVVFTAGAIEVHGGEFFPTPLDYTLSGTGNPTVILDDALFNVGFGTTREDLLVANSIGHKGSFTAQDGATVAAANVLVGVQRNTQGELILSGPGTTMQVATKLTLGQNAGTSNDPARGTLRIENQAIATVAEIDIGQAGFGEATIDGGTLNVVQNPSNTRSGELRIGGLAPSSLTIQNGGIANARIVDIASTVASTASLVVTGDGSQLNVTSGIAVGDSNEGKLRVLDGGRVTAASLATGLGTGLGANEKNEIQIDGSQTRVSATGTLWANVGGEVSISGGAQVTAGTAAAIGGTLKVSGLQTVLDASVTTSMVASFGAPRGTARIEGGALVRSRGLEIGTLSGTGLNSVVVTGAGSRLISEGLFFVVGNLRPGALNIEAGAVVERTGDVFVAASNTAPSDLRIMGDGSRLDVAGDLYLSGGRVDGQVFTFTATGMLNIQDGATVDVAGTIEPFPSGQINLQGGSLSADEITLQTGSQFNFTGGRLAVESFVGDLVNDGGTFAPGQSPGISNISGLFDQNAGALEIEIFAGGTTPTPGIDFDQVLADSVQLGGALEIILGDGYQPALGDSFPIIEAATSLAGQFESIEGADLGNGLAFDVLVDQLARNVTLQVIQSTLAGDYNSDGRVDAADYVVWRKNEGLPDGYNAWRMNFGNALGSGSAAAVNAAVPEPAGVVIAVVGILLVINLPQARGRVAGATPQLHLT